MLCRPHQPASFLPPVRMHFLNALILCGSAITFREAAAQQAAASAVGELTVEATAPSAPQVGRPDRITVRIRGTSLRWRTLIVTPVANGAAVSVLKGRLLSTDEVRPGGYFEVPVLPLQEGIASVRIDAQAYRCDAATGRARNLCQLVRQTVDVTFRVQRNATR